MKKNNGQSTMIKAKLAVGLCLFLTLAPIIGSFISADSSYGKIIGHYTPYIHLAMPQLSGLPFAESAGGFWGICILITGIIGCIMYFTKQHTSGFRFLLYMTVIYCIFRILGAIMFNTLLVFRYDKSEIALIIAAIITDFIWMLFSYWAANILKSNKE